MKDYNTHAIIEDGNHLNHIGLFNLITKLDSDCRMMQLSIDVLELQVKLLKSTIEALQRRLDFLEKTN